MSHTVKGNSFNLRLSDCRLYCLLSVNSAVPFDHTKGALSDHHSHHGRKSQPDTVSFVEKRVSPCYSHDAIVSKMLSVFAVSLTQNSLYSNMAAAVTGTPEATGRIHTNHRVIATIRPLEILMLNKTPIRTRKNPRHLSPRTVDDHKQQGQVIVMTSLNKATDVRKGVVVVRRLMVNYGIASIVDEKR